MDDEDNSKVSTTEVKAVATIPAPVSAAKTASKDLLALKLNLTAKELKQFQNMIAWEVRMEHLLQAAAQEGVDMPALLSLPLPPDPLGEFTAV